MESINESAVRNGLLYLCDRGWSELIDPRWTIDVREELERSGLGLTEAEIIEICNVVIFPKPDWKTTERLSHPKWTTRQEQINAAIKYNGFSEHTLILIDNYTNDILNGKTIYSMEEQILIDLINKSMQASALQIRRSLGRMPYAVTREQALNQVLMLQRAKEAQQIGK